MIRILTDTTFNRLCTERDDAQLAADRKEADTAIVREELFETKGALAEARENVQFYSDLAERWWQRLLSNHAEAETEIAHLREAIERVTRERDTARAQLREHQAGEPPYVHVYLLDGWYQAVAVTSDGAKAAAERDGVPLDVWEVCSGEDCGHRSPYEIQVWPVVGPWLEPGRVWIVFRGLRPTGVYGNRAAADRAVAADPLKAVLVVQPEDLVDATPNQNAISGTPSTVSEAASAVSTTPSLTPSGGSDDDH